MTFANVDIGENPGDGQGDPLRAAFNKINQNFQQIADGEISITVNAPVESVAGRTGNVILSVNDVIGSVSRGYVDSAISASNVSLRTYTDAQITSAISYLTDSAPGVLDTINELAAALDDDPNFATSLLNRISSFESNVTTTLNVAVPLWIQGNINSVQSNVDTVVANSISTQANVLITNLQNEISRATAAELTLANSITNTNSNVSTVSSDLAAEVLRASAAESTLGNLITNAESNISSVSSSLGSEVTRATQAESTLGNLIANTNSNVSTVSTSLSSEVTRATQAESTLGNLITNAESNISSVSSSLTSLIANVVANAESNISTVSTSLSSEVTRATSAEADLASNIALKADITYVDSAVSNLVSTAPTTLDTLNELAVALGNDANLSVTLTSLIGNVASNVSNVSTALGSEVTRATSAEADLASNIALKADTSALANVATSGSYSDLSGTPVLANVATSGNYSDLSGTPTLATVATSGNYSDLFGAPVLATNVSAFSNDSGYITGIDFANVSAKPTTISGYGITDAFDGSYSSLSGAPTLANVATSGNYSDLTNTPVLATVATTGSYNDLSDIPTGNFTFANNTIGVSATNAGITIDANGNGEIVLSDQVGINNTNPGYTLHVGNQTDISQTGGIGISFGNLDVIGGEASLTWDWSDGAGNGSNPDGAHARFGIFKNGSITDPWLTFDANAPADVLEVDADGRFFVTNGQTVIDTDATYKAFSPWGARFVTSKSMTTNGSSNTTSYTEVGHSFITEARIGENLTKYDRIRGFSSALDVVLNGVSWDSWLKFPTVSGGTISGRATGTGTLSQITGNSAYAIIRADAGPLNIVDTPASVTETDTDPGMAIGMIGGVQLFASTADSSTVDYAIGLSPSILVDSGTAGGSATVTHAVGLYLPYRGSSSNSWARILNGGVITNRFSVHSEDPNAILRNYGDIETNGAIVFDGGARVFAGSYTDLADKPTIPADISDLTDTTNLLSGGGGGGWDGTTISDDLIPDTDIAYDLGSPTNRFRDLYLNTSTLYLGTLAVSVNNSGQVIISETVQGGEGVGGIASIEWVTNNTLEIRTEDDSEFVEKFDSLKKGDVIELYTGSNGTFASNTNITVDGTVTKTLNGSGDYYDFVIPVDLAANANVYVYSFSLVRNPVTDIEQLGGNVATLVNGTATFTIVDAPAASIGQAGDTAGMTANDANYHYYCTASYDGVTDIWKRVGWSSDTW